MLIQNPLSVLPTRDINVREQIRRCNMGITISSMLARLFAGPADIRLLMVGLDGAGKTTILYKLKLGEVVTTIPTIGFNVETVQYRNLTFTVWDIGGQDKIRMLWRHYFRHTRGLVYVVDASDRERIATAAAEMHTILKDEEMRDVVVLVMANKQDLPRSLAIGDLVEAFDMRALGARPWHVQGTCAWSGDGLYEGLDWLSRVLEAK